MIEFNFWGNYPFTGQIAGTQAIQDDDEFVSSSEQIWRNLALHHLLTNEWSAVNGCRQNDSPNSW